MTWELGRNPDVLNAAIELRERLATAIDNRAMQAENCEDLYASLDRAFDEIDSLLAELGIFGTGEEG